jgi:nucleoside-diphosphate-sugar epimerase
MNRIVLEDLKFIVDSDVDLEKFKGTTVVITGGYGMLLSYITLTFLHLNKLGYNVRIVLLVRDKDKALKRLNHYLDCELEDLDIVVTDLSSDIPVHGQVDYIFHGASLASPHCFVSTPVDVIMPNVLGTYYLLELARAKKVKSFLLFSSGAVYGKFMDKEEVKETDYGYLDPFDLGSCYGESKRMAENMCISWYHQFGVPVKVVRPAHIYGPTMDISTDTRLFANFVNDAISSGRLLIKSDGSTHRSFCYIADATVGFFKVILSEENCQQYNVGNDDAYMSITELASLFINTLKEKQLTIEYIKSSSTSSPSKYLNSMLMVSDKLNSIGWECRFSLQEGISRTVDSYMEYHFRKEMS